MGRSSCFYHSDVSQFMGPAALGRHFFSVLSLLLIYGHGRRGLLTASARCSQAPSQDCGHASGHVREGARRHPWGKCPPCLGTALTPHGMHPWATGTGPEGGTWTLRPEGKEEGNRESICKPMAAVTNACSKNVGLNGNG